MMLISMNLFCWPPSVDIFNILPGFLWQPLLTTWKLSHVIKTKFLENEKRVLKKKTSKKKKRKKKKEKEKKKKKKRKICPDEIWTCAFGREKQRINTELTPSTTPANAEEDGLKQDDIPSLQWLKVFRNTVLGFLYNYRIFNWT